MASRTANFCFDAIDPKAHVAWWAQVLDDFVPDENQGGDEAGLTGPGGRWIGFLRVPEPKTTKNRMHLCLRPADRGRDEEVERLLSLGATMATTCGSRARAGLCSPIPRPTSSASSRSQRTTRASGVTDAISRGRPGACAREGVRQPTCQRASQRSRMDRTTCSGVMPETWMWMSVGMIVTCRAKSSYCSRRKWGSLLSPRVGSACARTSASS